MCIADVELDSNKCDFIFLNFCLQINLSSGLVLVGLTPGQVKLQLLVFTDNKALSGQLIEESGRGKFVAELSAELVVTIIPNLSLLTPFRLNPKVLVSPNSMLQLQLPTSL